MFIGVKCTKTNFLFFFFCVDPYITIKLLFNNEVISKKKTTVKKGAYPIWNEPFVFDLVETDVHNYELVFAVKNRDLFSSSSKLGSVCIGPQTSLTGKQHWKTSVCSKNNTMRQVTMSHRLLWDVDSAVCWRLWSLPKPLALHYVKKNNNCEEQSGDEAE